MRYQSLAETPAVASIAVLVLPVLVVLSPIVVGWSHMGDGMWGNWGVWGWFWMLVMMLVPVVLIVAIAYLLYRAGSGQGGDSAIEELRRAYARGDISDEEFERRRNRLERNR